MRRAGLAVLATAVALSAMPASGQEAGPAALPDRGPPAYELESGRPLAGDPRTGNGAFAQSGGCGPAGGGAIPDPAPAPGEFALIGGGWGHGAGMSQYGAQGAARLGCDSATILTTYFPSTAVSTRGSPPLIVLGLAQAAQSSGVTAEDGAVPYELCHYQTLACADTGLVQPEGATWTVSVQPDASYRVTDGVGSEVWAGGDFEHNLRAKLSLSDAERRIASVSVTGHAYRWGVVQFDSVAASPPHMFLTLEIGSFQRYLKGIAEVPVSWPQESLEAQAIAARSYAVRRIEALGLRDECRCHLYPTPRDQNYEGWDLEAEDAQFGGHFAAAVDATDDQVLTYQGGVAETFYSSSHGGYSESTRFVFGGALAYTAPVDDSRWDLQSDNPYRRWTRGFSATEVGAVAGVGTAADIDLLPPLGAGGRVGDPDRGYGGVRITGSGGAATISGDDLRLALGLRSTLYRVAVEPAAQPPPPGPPPPPPPPPPDVIARIAASNRILTAVEASRAGWTTADAAVLATAGSFPDALSAVALAASLDAPLLLSDAGALPDAVGEELSDLGVDTVHLMGGTAALSDGVVAHLQAQGFDVARIAGATRYETAAMAAQAAGTPAHTVALVAADTFPDAVAAGALAASPQQIPTLLTLHGSVPAPTLAALAELEAGTVLVVGGEAVISDAAVQQLRALGYAVERLAGSSRWGTSAIVGDRAVGLGAGGPLVMASGSGFADALSAGALTARLEGTLLLVPPADLDDAPETAVFVSAHDEFDGGLIVGGTSAVSDVVERQLETALSQ